MSPNPQFGDHCSNPLSTLRISVMNGHVVHRPVHTCRCIPLPPRSASVSTSKSPHLCFELHRGILLPQFRVPALISYQHGDGSEREPLSFYPPARRMLPGFASPRAGGSRAAVTLSGGDHADYIWDTAASLSSFFKKNPLCLG